MKKLAIGLTLVLAACSAAQVAQFQQITQVTCQKDAQLQPIVVQITPVLVPKAQGVADVDAQLIHPAVVAACAVLAAKPISVK